MVKFRGISVSIVSQFDIRRLPEFMAPSPSDQDFSSLHLPRSDPSIVSCYIPVYPGSQIWFEYSIDGPHPPNASYFFKMLHNGNLVTGFDCTAKHGYHGKAAYRLEYIGQDNFTKMPLVKRQAFKFSEKESAATKTSLDGCIEIRVHRVENRKRIPIESFLGTETTPLCRSNSDGFSLVNGGLVDSERSQRRYKYQLLDPIDEPYATFRFIYRSYEFLEQQNIIQALFDDSCTVSSIPSPSSVRAK